MKLAPAYPIVNKFKQPNGAAIEIRLWGDEFAHGWETLDSFTVVKSPKSGYWEYAVRDSSGKLIPSGVIVSKGLPPAPPHLHPSEDAINERRSALGAPALGQPYALAPPPWAGANTRILFIMVAFTDVPCNFTATQMQTNLFGGGASGPGDLDDYFREISYGALQLNGTVVGCFTLSHQGFLRYWSRNRRWFGDRGGDLSRLHS